MPGDQAPVRVLAKLAREVEYAEGELLMEG